MQATKHSAVVMGWQWWLTDKTEKEAVKQTQIAEQSRKQELILL